MAQPILEIKNLKKHYPIKTGLFNKVVGKRYVVDGISLRVNEGETVVLVGESNCGKTVLLRTLLGLEKPTEGTVEFEGKCLLTASRAESKKARQRMGMIFQDAMGSLHPRMTIDESLQEALLLTGDKDAQSQRDKVTSILKEVGLDPAFRQRYPDEFSGGQRQRVAIARALIIQPKILLADEPISALDVSLQAQVLNLFMDLQDKKNLAILFVAHDLAVVRQIAHRILIMYMGTILEEGSNADIYANAQHPYTQVLLKAAPSISKGVLDEGFKVDMKIGDTPDPSAPPSGCLFHTRCTRACDICAQERPPYKEISPDHFVCCHFV